jgi:TolB protein
MARIRTPMTVAWFCAWPGILAAQDYTIAFGSLAPVDMDIFIAEADGSNAQPLLPNPDQDYNASFSKDGRWIVFTSERNGSADIYRVHPDGTDLERLIADPAFDDQAVMSPDGEQLAFVSTRGGQADIWLLDLTTKALRNLTNHPDGDFRPAWSPDGEWIAFSTERHSTKPRVGFGVPVLSTEIYVIRADGSETRRITEADAIEGSPSWSPDGGQLAFHQAADLVELVRTVSPPQGGPPGTFQVVVVDVSTLTPRVITSGPGEKWSPRWLTSERIGFASRAGLEFTNGTAGIRGEFRNPNWSADGRRVVFHRDVDLARPTYRRHRSRDSQFNLIRSGIFPSYSPRGDRLVVNDQFAGGMHNALLVMNADGSNRIVAYRHPEKNALAPAWSHSGDRIAFALGGFFQMLPQTPRAGADIAIVSSEGRDLQILTEGTGNYAFPSWSPDDRRLVYRSFAPPGLFVIDVETRSATPLIMGPHNFPAWAPKGDRIAFVSTRDGDSEIYAIKPDGSDLTRLTHSPGLDAHLSWSPDGEWIAFSSDRGIFKDEAGLYVGNAQSRGDIYVMRADGSDLRQLTDDQFEEATSGWMPLVGD